VACLGVHFAITNEVAQRLLAAEDDDELVDIVKEEIEPAWDEEHLFETGKAWDALHRCLSDGTMDVAGGTPPLNLCFFGGRVLNKEADYFVVLITPQQVKQTADALKKVDREWLRHRYESLQFPDYQGVKNDEDFEHASSQFEGLPEFFAQAASEGRYVVFTVDQ
jgi:hypothetical protein